MIKQRQQKKYKSLSYDNTNEVQIIKIPTNPPK
jgi:hypothetical protein